MREYRGIEVGRVIFACFIPFLHIGFQGQVMYYIRECFSRLGVPFFFVVTGMFLIKSIEKHGAKEALKKYIKRIGKMYFFWLAIYFPILCMRDNGISIQEILFLSPAYLWYLMALLVAVVPFCLIKNRKILFWSSIILYIIGTIFGGAYKWLTGGLPIYEMYFLTTRNAIFFALPLMCVGERTWRRERISVPLLVTYGVVFIIEVIFVSLYSSPMDDRSMYLSIPLLIFELVLLFRQWSPKIKTQLLSGISSAIYVMQFGIITIMMKIKEIINIQSAWSLVVIYICVCIIPIMIYQGIRKTRLVKEIF